MEVRCGTILRKRDRHPTDDMGDAMKDGSLLSCLPWHHHHHQTIIIQQQAERRISASSPSTSRHLANGIFLRPIKKSHPGTQRGDVRVSRGQKGFYPRTGGELCLREGTVEMFAWLSAAFKRAVLIRAEPQKVVRQKRGCVRLEK
ncbi:xylose isomerase [Anopheles sinensis]|uniref:Xylose isomerase n=1 Tax=Anopheles sinensis TaxID=74873 RepID=A0A084W4Q6_ANOSI|nr:xylose isomerase [Anopheles sinensis]